MPRILIREPGKNPQPYRFGLDSGTVTLGRAADNDIVLSCGSISSHHASMERVRGGFSLLDNRSTNGMTYSGVKIEQADLSNGQRLKLGDVEFEFQLSEEELAALAAEGPGEVAMPDQPAGRDGGGSSKGGPTGPPQLASAAGGMGFFQVLVLFVLLVAAFWYGMATRHKNEFGISLGEAVLRGHPAPKAEENGPPPAPAREQSEAARPEESEGVPEGLEGWEQRDRSEEEREE